jgi:hypothetical protein
VSKVSRSEAGIPGWAVVAVAVGGVLVGVWLIGAVMSAVGFLFKLALSIGVIVVIAWLLVSALTRGSRQT